MHLSLGIDRKRGFKQHQKALDPLISEVRAYRVLAFSGENKAFGRVFSNPLFGEPVVCTLDSLGFRHCRGMRDFREPSTQLLVCSCLSCLRHFRRFRGFRRFREWRPACTPQVCQTTLKTLTSLNKEVRPFFLGDRGDPSRKNVFRPPSPRYVLPPPPPIPFLLVRPLS